MATADSYRLARALREWLDQHPLRRWRATHRVPRVSVAAFIGVTPVSVTNWEHGVSWPSAEHMARLIALTEQPDLPVQWDQWYQQRPHPQPQEVHA